MKPITARIQKSTNLGMIKSPAKQPTNEAKKKSELKVTDNGSIDKVETKTSTSPGVQLENKAEKVNRSVGVKHTGKKLESGKFEKIMRAEADKQGHQSMSTKDYISLKERQNAAGGNKGFQAFDKGTGKDIAAKDLNPSDIETGSSSTSGSPSYTQGPDIKTTTTSTTRQKVANTGTGKGSFETRQDGRNVAHLARKIKNNTIREGNLQAKIDKGGMSEKKTRRITSKLAQAKSKNEANSELLSGVQSRIKQGRSAGEQYKKADTDATITSPGMGGATGNTTTKTTGGSNLFSSTSARIKKDNVSDLSGTLAGLKKNYFKNS